MDGLISDFLRNHSLPISKAEIRRRYKHLTPRQAIAAMRRLKGCAATPEAKARWDILWETIRVLDCGLLMFAPKGLTVAGSRMLKATDKIVIRRPGPYL